MSPPSTVLVADDEARRVVLATLAELEREWGLPPGRWAMTKVRPKLEAALRSLPQMGGRAAMPRGLPAKVDGWARAWIEERKGESDGEEEGQGGGGGSGARRGGRGRARVL